MQPDVSFVIAAFNAQASLARAIRKRARPARRDASRSSSSTIARATARSRSRDSFAGDAVRVVALEKNRGPGGARNAGLEAAQGRWIAVLDSDDTVYPDRIARMIRRGERLQAADRRRQSRRRRTKRSTGGRTMFSSALLESLAEIGLADFIAANLMFDRHLLVRLHEADLRAAVPANSTRCATTRRCGSARTISCSPRRWPRAGAASSSPKSAIPIMSGQDRSRGCSNASRRGDAGGRRGLPRAPISSMRQRQAAQARRTRSLEEAAAFPGARPASEGPRAAEGGRRGAARSGGVAPSENADRGAGCGGSRSSFSARAFDQSAKRPATQFGIGRGGSTSNRDDAMRKVRKAVIPVAGLGTRFLPATKAMPKEMLTIVDRPVVQYAVDEALEAGIEHIVFVTGRNKHVIEDYFDIQPELVDTLTRSGKLEQLVALSACNCRPAPSASPASRRRTGSAMRCGARATSSATSRSRCCCPTWFRSATRAASPA